MRHSTLDFFLGLMDSSPRLDPLLLHAVVSIVDNCYKTGLWRRHFQSSRIVPLTTQLLEHDRLVLKEQVAGQCLFLVMS